MLLLLHLCFFIRKVWPNLEKKTLVPLPSARECILVAFPMCDINYIIVSLYLHGIVLQRKVRSVCCYLQEHVLLHVSNCIFCILMSSIQKYFVWISDIQFNIVYDDLNFSSHLHMYIEVYILKMCVLCHIILHWSHIPPIKEIHYTAVEFTFVICFQILCVIAFMVKFPNLRFGMFAVVLLNLQKLNYEQLKKWHKYLYHCYFHKFYFPFLSKINK